MGSGKTTIGRKLAAKLGYEFMDLDAAIEKAEGMYIRDIINEKSEAYFREVESHTLKLLDLSNKVISTGGGTPYYFDNMDWMKMNGTVIYIALDEAALYSRLKMTDLENRPLLKGLDDEGLKAFIHNKLTEREPYYAQAHLRFNPIRESVVGLIQKIALY